MNLNEKIDVTNVIPIGVDFTIGNSKYTLIYNYRSILRLIQQYGSVQNALEDFTNGDLYDSTINFLYCGLYDEYDLDKQEIEQWIGMDILPWRNIVYNAIAAAYGAQIYSEDKAEDNDKSGE